MDANLLLSYVDAGHNLVVAAEAGCSDLTREVISECGIDVVDS